MPLNRDFIGRTAPAGEPVEVTRGDTFGLKIEKADGEKCDRCWNYSTRVGEFEKYPTVCERCAEALDQIS